jgi:hypothetical protein
MDTLKRVQGKFALKSHDERQVRSIRATNRVWDDFGFEADKLRITRADLLESWVKQTRQVNPSALALLEEALTVKANTGGAIKQKIRQALELL